MGRRRNRGRSKARISDLSRAAPTNEEIDALVEIVGDSGLHPVSAAILGAVLVENELDNELQRLIPRKNVWDELTTEVGPLSTFHRKIVMGHALRLYNDDFRENLEIVKAIRNQFAHSKRIIDFKNPLIVREIAKAKNIPNSRRDFREYVKNNSDGPQEAYLSLCVLLTCALMKKSTKAIRARNNRLVRTIDSLRYKIIAAGLLNQQLSPQVLSRANALVTQGGHPIASTHLGLLNTPPSKGEAEG